MFTPNKMQEKAIEDFYHWFHNPSTRKRPWFEISGAAGTGKTATVHAIVQRLGLDENINVVYVAYVGKATLALRLAGVNAKTIHSTIYDIKVVKETDKFGEIQYREKFVKKESLPPEIKLIVLDEGGMVGGHIAEDLMSYNIPLLVLGDLKQLPPVMAQRTFLEYPDIILTEIMRQSKDSPIIYLSQLASNGIRIPYGEYSDKVRVISRNDLTDEMLMESEMTICNTNSMRDQLNYYIRTNLLNIKPLHLVIGDKLICRKNRWTCLLNPDIALVNGMIGYVQCVYRESKSGANMEIDFRPEFSETEYFERLPIISNYPFLSYTERLKTNPRLTPYNIFEFGHAITCHLAQGSQADNVLVYGEISNCTTLYNKQWLYTAITRSKDSLTLIL